MNHPIYKPLKEEIDELISYWDEIHNHAVFLIYISDYAINEFTSSDDLTNDDLILFLHALESEDKLLSIYDKAIQALIQHASSNLPSCQNLLNVTMDIYCKLSDLRHEFRTQNKKFNKFLSERLL